MFKNRTHSLSIAVCAALLSVSFQASAALIKCWENNHGVRECGTVVPQEYSQKRIEIINDRGLIVKIVEAAKTKAQLAKERERKRAQKEREDRRKERARLDTILLNTYTTERDLLLAKETNLKGLDGQVEISKGNLRVLEEILVLLRQRAADYERSGKKPPKNLVEEIGETKQQINTKIKHIALKIGQKDKMAERFDKDLKRFRKLKHLD